MRGLAVLALVLVFAGAAVAAQPQKITIKEKGKGYDVDISYPRLGHAAMDRQIEVWVRGIARDFVGIAHDEPGAANPWAVEVSYEIMRADAQMVVVSFVNYNYTGGAHPNASSETFNFLLPDGRRVEFAEVFTAKGVQRVSDIAIARLKQDLGGPDGMGDMDWIKRGAGPNARNFASFALLPRELVITFDAYQVAAYAAGPQEVRIPLAHLRDVMRPDPRAPAASFDCRNARSEVERAICSSHGLATLDRHLGEAYAAKFDWEDDATKRQAIRDKQRTWIKARDAVCRGVAIVACLTGMYQRRLKELGD